MSNAKGAVPLSKVVSELESAERQAAQIVDGLSEQQANWQPGKGSWSIVQCLNHLARINRMYVAPIQEAILAAASATRSSAGSPVAISPGWFGAWFIRSLEPPVRRRMRAPRPALPANCVSDASSTLAEFISSHRGVRKVVESTTGMDVNRVRFKNPFIGLLRFTLGTGLLVINAHDRRHLGQAQLVKKAPGFPKEDR